MLLKENHQDLEYSLPTALQHFLVESLRRLDNHIQKNDVPSWSKFIEILDHILLTDCQGKSSFFLCLDLIQEACDHLS